MLIRICTATLDDDFNSIAIKKIDDSAVYTDRLWHGE